MCIIELPVNGVVKLNYMKVIFNRTEKALIARGLSSDIARKLCADGHSLSSLKLKSIDELHTLGITKTIAKGFGSGRVPIPDRTLSKLLFKNKWVCCICRDNSVPVVVHHIIPWVESKSHDINNLVVLCPNCHAKSHTKGDLNQNLTPKKLKALKEQWENKVKLDDSILVSKAAQANSDHWYFFNLLRLYEIAEDTRVDLKRLSHYKHAKNAGILNSKGNLVPEKADGMYVYSGKNSILMYWYARELFFEVLSKLSVTNVSDRFDKCDLGNTVITNDVIYIEGAFTFKLLNNLSNGADQTVQATRSANSIKIIFSFDRWFATSTSAHTTWLSGRQVVGCFCKVRNIEREDGKIIIKCSVLAICSELNGLRNRSYMSYCPQREINIFDGLM